MESNFFLRCNTVTSSPSSCYSACYLLVSLIDFLFNLEDGSSTFLLNVSQAPENNKKAYRISGAYLATLHLDSPVSIPG